MLFNSVEFALFLPVVFALYWAIEGKGIRNQNFLLLAASYVFYGWWDWRFLTLIVFSSLTDYLVGRGLGVTAHSRRRKMLLLTSLFVNLGLLGTFKYFNFFAESFAQAFTLLGEPFDPVRLNVVLPVGISFYTFQTLSYTIDVYRRKFEPTGDALAFFAFVSFFPQLVAGPIERASNLLPQFFGKRKFEYAKAVDGLRQIAWGLFKKIVIADSCAEYANQIFDESDKLNGSTLLVGVLFFAFQIYGDFSGYSDIAIGTARLFGFSLMKNFAFPYFSRDIAEFWRRWHISLSTWFRDYVYIPLGGSRGGLSLRIRNVLIIFIISGFWHGADWTFIVWGTLHALYFLPLQLSNNNRRYLDTVADGRSMPRIRELAGIGITFGLTVFAWIFFRAENMAHALSYAGTIFSGSLFSVPDFIGMKRALLVASLVVVFMMIEWHGRHQEYGIALLGLTWKRPFRWAFYFLLVVCLMIFSGQEQEFIYFQF